MGWVFPKPQGEVLSFRKPVNCGRLVSCPVWAPDGPMSREGMFPHARDGTPRGRGHTSPFTLGWDAWGGNLGESRERGQALGNHPTP